MAFAGQLGRVCMCVCVWEVNCSNFPCMAEMVERSLKGHLLEVNLLHQKERSLRPGKLNACRAPDCTRANGKQILWWR